MISCYEAIQSIYIPHVLLWAVWCQAVVRDDICVAGKKQVCSWRLDVDGGVELEAQGSRWAVENMWLVVGWCGTSNCGSLRCATSCECISLACHVRPRDGLCGDAGRDGVMWLVRRWCDAMNCGQLRRGMSFDCVWRACLLWRCDRWRCDGARVAAGRDAVMWLVMRWGAASNCGSFRYGMSCDCMWRFRWDGGDYAATVGCAISWCERVWDVATRNSGWLYAAGMSFEAMPWHMV